MVSQQVHISRSKSPQSYITAVQLKLNKLGRVQLVALEGAMVVAVDLANIMCCSSFAEMDAMETSTVQVKSKNLPTTNTRNRIQITLKKLNNEESAVRDKS